jgi:type III restriction enzyme
MWLEQSEVQSVYESTTFDAVYATRLLVDVIPNAWVVRGIITELICGLKSRGLDDMKLGSMSSLILEELRKWIVDERDRLAEARFRAYLEAGNIQFGLKWFLDVWQLPYELEPDQQENARQLMRTTGGPLEKSMFTPVYQGDFNGDEANFACYLDAQATVQWWHRNIAKAGQYSLQGWKKGLVYPDFIFAHRTGAGRDRLSVWETKGDHLGGKDTDYKRKLLQTISDHYQTIPKVRAGELELIFSDETEVPVVNCNLVLMTDWRLLVDETLEE